ncbi:MAG: glucosamine-6-phosphate deaminase [Spirulina sp. SIO3F2]|nr:glucosamine-6-phosphate deaminase [Spirulina sp. SIO3F2]
MTVASFNLDNLTVTVLDSAEQLADYAAQTVAQTVREVVQEQGTARVVWATGNSQIAFLERLPRKPDVPWSQVTGFHLDEYLGIDPAHPASFRRYLQQKLCDRLPLAAFHALQGDALEPLRECDRYSQLLNAQPIDLCILGIGNNGHLAFNDPSVADFDDPYTVKLAKLEATNRQQQLSQGHFPRLEDVPAYAFTLTLSRIVACRRLLCLVPGAHKAAIVERLLTGEISPQCPATLLRQHPQATLLLDRAAAGQVKLD